MYTSNKKLLLLLLAQASQILGCPGHGYVPSSEPQAPHGHAKYDTIPAYDPSQRIAIDNVRVFDGHRLLPLGTVVIDGGLIGTDASNAVHIDGKGGVLLPGLIDSHAHAANITHMQQLSRWGVTTVMNLSCTPDKSCDDLRQLMGLSDLHSAGLSAVAPGSAHARMLSQIPGFDPTEMVSTPAEGTAFVARRVASGSSEFIKMVAETPGLDQATMNAIAVAAKKANFTSNCHAAEYDAYMMAQIARANIIHHVPLNFPLNDTLSLRLSGHVTVPTLVVGELFTTTNNSLRAPGDNFPSVLQSAKTIHKAGNLILAGTDSAPNPQVAVPFGKGLHRELELMVMIGMTPVEALRAATVTPAQVWGFPDRGSIEVGKRADLVLISGNPLTNISATRQIERVWLRGVEFSL